MNIDFAIQVWVRWKDRLDELEVKRATGVKPYGIEYRIMLEGKAAHLDPKKPFMHEQLVTDVDLVWRRINQWYPAEMQAVEIFYKRKKSFRAVRVQLGLSQHMARKLVNRGQDFLIGGLASIAGFEEHS